MENKVVCRIIETEQSKYESLGIMPYHHLVIDGDTVFVYIWDTRVIEQVLPVNCILQSDITYAVLDNRLDLVCEFDTEKRIKDKCLEHKESMPIMFLGETLTEDERSLLNINHY